MWLPRDVSFYDLKLLCPLRRSVRFAVKMSSTASKLGFGADHSRTPAEGRPAMERIPTSKYCLRSYTNYRLKRNRMNDEKDVEGEIGHSMFCYALLSLADQ